MKMNPNSSTPAKFVASYESSNNHYDPQFTAEISTKMRVPEKISVIPGVELRESKLEKNQFFDDNLGPVKEKLNYMHVPDRILVTGGNKHIAGREPFLNSDELQSLEDDIGLKTPPNVLTVKDIKSKLLYNNEEELNRNELLYSSFNNSANLISTQTSSENDSQNIKKQMKSLHRRIYNLEKDNRSRYQREIIFYALGLIYLTAKSLYWFQRRW